MNEKYDKIQMDGVFSKGYGIIYKFVMTDHELSIEAKAIYSYFCACAGNGTTAFPSRSKVLNDLQISKNTYYLNEKASVEAFATKEAETNKNISIAENWDTAKCDTENEDSDLWDTEICDTTNNSNTNNKNNIISPSITDADRMTDDISISAVLENAISGEPIPNSLLFDEVKRIELVHALSEWDTFSSSRAWFGHDGTANHDTYIMAVNAIVDMLDPSSKPLHLAGNSVSYRRFADELCRHIQTGCYPSGRKYYTISEILMDVQGKYKYALKNYSVQNKTGIDEVIRLTDKGKAFITDYLDDPYYFENYKKFERKFNIRDKSELPMAKKQDISRRHITGPRRWPLQKLISKRKRPVKANCSLAVIF